MTSQSLRLLCRTAARLKEAGLLQYVSTPAPVCSYMSLQRRPLIVRLLLQVGGSLPAIGSQLICSSGAQHWCVASRTLSGHLGC